MHWGMVIALFQNSDQQTIHSTIYSSNNIIKIILSKRFQLEYKIVSYTFTTLELYEKIVMRVVI